MKKPWAKPQIVANYNGEALLRCQYEQAGGNPIDWPPNHRDSRAQIDVMRRLSWGTSATEPRDLVTL